MNRYIGFSVLALTLLACGGQQSVAHTANDVKPCPEKNGDKFDKAGETIGSAIATSSRWTVSEAKDFYDYMTNETNKERAEFVWAAFTNSLSKGVSAAIDAAKSEYDSYQKAHPDTK